MMFEASLRALSSLRVKRSNPVTSLHTLSSLRVKRSNPVTSLRAEEVDTKCRMRRGLDGVATSAKRRFRHRHYRPCADNLV